MRRRKVIVAGLAAAAWPLVARAQPAMPVRRVGVLTGSGVDDAEFRRWIGAFNDALQELGWTDGRNIQVELRAARGDVDRLRTFASELVGLRPQVILANPTPATAALQQVTHDIPIVFVNVSDPVGSGFVDSFARPGRNITGFTLFEASLGGKWLGLLREIAPGVGRVGMLFNPNTAASGTSGGIYLRAIETSAQATGVKLLTLPVHNPAGIEPAIHSLALEPGGGMLVMPNLFTVFHRRRIVELATTQKVPAVYPYRYFVTEGGLAAYGVDSADLFRRAALYVDRLLRGAKVDELPVQAPTKFELAINLKTAAALGLTVPPTLLTRADEVVE